MRSFETEAEFTIAINAAMRSDAIPDAVRAALIAGVAKGEAEARATPPEANGTLNLRLGGWVLRETDIPVTEMIAIVGAATIAALAPGVIAAGAVVTALTGFATLAWKTWRRGATLSKPEIAVLGFLQIQGPMTLDELKAKAPAAIPDVTATDVERAIASLQGVELRDGNIVELIRKDAAGQWRSRPV